MREATPDFWKVYLLMQTEIIAGKALLWYNFAISTTADSEHNRGSNSWFFRKYINKCHRRTYSRGSHSYCLTIYHQLQIQNAVREETSVFLKSILINAIKKLLQGCHSYNLYIPMSTTADLDHNRGCNSWVFKKKCIRLSEDFLSLINCVDPDEMQH